MSLGSQYKRSVLPWKCPRGGKLPPRGRYTKGGLAKQDFAWSTQSHWRFHDAQSRENNERNDLIIAPAGDGGRVGSAERHRSPHLRHREAGRVHVHRHVDGLHHCLGGYHHSPLPTQAQDRYHPANWNQLGTHPRGASFNPIPWANNQKQLAACFSVTLAQQKFVRNLVKMGRGGERGESWRILKSLARIPQADGYIIRVPKHMQTEAVRGRILTSEIHRHRTADRSSSGWESAIRLRPHLRHLLFRLLQRVAVGARKRRRLVHHPPPHFQFDGSIRYLSLPHPLIMRSCLQKCQF